MAIEKPISIEFIKDHNPSTYTVTSSNISFRALSSAAGTSTPDYFSSFDGDTLQRITYSSGADGGAMSGNGDLFSSLSNNWASFQDTAPAGTNRYVYFYWNNTDHYQYLTSRYQIRVYIYYHSLASGSFTSGNIFLQNYNGSSWNVKAVLPPYPSMTYYTLSSTTDWGSTGNYWRTRIQNLGTSSCTLNLKVGVRIITI